jgi:SpoVK/Ycf46/Vps4 family AAA+-type ATPase
MSPPLLEAFNKNDLSQMEALLKAGEDVNQRFNDDYTLLMLACGTGNVSLVNLLLLHQADPNLKNTGGSTALKLAILKGQTGILKLLLSKGADPNLKDEKGFTPLMYSVMNGDVAMVKLLLAGRADPSIQSDRGKKTARDFAQEKNFPELVELLKATPPAPAVAPTPEIVEADLIGQKAAKDSLAQVIAIAKVNQERVKRGLKPMQITLHAVFSGNPGTGKTTFARFYAQEIKKLGLLKTGQLIEVTRQDLVAEFIGQTATKTDAVVKKALGGVLFIDEAYSLKNAKEDSFGQECIDTLIKLIEDHRDDLIVILAGYTDEMRDFLHLNPGLKSRIPNEIFFEDFTLDELGLIFDSLCKKAGFLLSSDDRKFALDQIALKKKGRSFGNAREVRNLFERALAQQSARLGKLEINQLSEKELCTLIYSDLTEDRDDVATAPPAKGEKSDASSSAMSRLQALEGIPSVKTEIEELADFVKVTRLRSNQSSLLADINLHMIFTGNPGTGKTTVARLVGEIFKEMELLPSGHTVETDRSGLVGGYQGQTALKTKDKIEEALGGVLIIDEAYTLHRGTSEDAYGQEAIDTLLKMMEDERGKFVVILSGYPEEMDIFLGSNPGLKSRFGRILNFPDFNLDQLLDIAKSMATEHSFEFSPAASTQLEKILKTEQETQKDFANARAVRNLLEQAFKKQACRIVKLQETTPNLDSKALNTLEGEDLEEL